MTTALSNSFFAAVEADDERRIRELLSVDPSLAFTPNGGNYPLHLCHSEAIARALLEHGANVNARNEYGGTSLHTASDPSLVALFSRYGCDFSAADNGGLTALQSFMENDNLDMVIAIRAETSRNVVEADFPKLDGNTMADLFDENDETDGRTEQEVDLLDDLAALSHSMSKKMNPKLARAPCHSETRLNESTALQYNLFAVNDERVALEIATSAQCPTPIAGTGTTLSVTVSSPSSISPPSTPKKVGLASPFTTPKQAPRPLSGSVSPIIFPAAASVPSKQFSPKVQSSLSPVLNAPLLDAQYSIRLQAADGRTTSTHTKQSSARKLFEQSPTHARPPTPHIDENRYSSVRDNIRSNNLSASPRLFENVHSHLDASYSDRFIPSRTGSNFSNLGSILMESKKTSSSNNKSDKSDETESPHTQLLRSELLNQPNVSPNSPQKSDRMRQPSPAPSPHTRTFRFCSPKHALLADPTRPTPFQSSPLSQASFANNPPQKTVRKIAKQPYKILDAPTLKDDYYLNLVDWSPGNLLAVGLLPT
jgi:hypothetical protein